MLLKVRTFDPRNMAMNKCLHLTGIQVSPNPLFPTIMNFTEDFLFFLFANRTRRIRMIRPFNININPNLLHIQIDIHNLPRRLYSKYLSV